LEPSHNKEEDRKVFSRELLGRFTAKILWGGQIRNIRDKEKKDGKRTRDDGKIPQDKKT